MMQKAPKNLNTGTIRLITRRMVTLVDESGTDFIGKVRSRSLEAVVGDRVLFSIQDKEAIVTEILPRKNLLRRAAEEREKQLVSNLDLLCIVTAPYPLFNPRIIDRIIAAAILEEVEVVIILNKIDKPHDVLKESLEAYKKSGLKCFELSAKFETNLDEFLNFISNDKYKNISLCGVSGVGKSSLLKRIIPGVEVRTEEVSERTGQGKQTTSQAIGYSRKLSPHDQLIIDLPGVQKFGLHHIDKYNLQRGWSEVFEASSKCKFRDCLHEQEPDCEVLRQLECGEIASFRYEHYIEVLQELKTASQY